MVKYEDLTTILDIAKIRFPIGTKYVGIGNNKITEHIKDSYDHSRMDIYLGGIAIGHHYNLLYKNGEWAKIICTPKIIELW